ncbi:uncharacterized protein PV07_11017 [Cladophialophora immunda]|uniref:Uncharacterized protein n=1 Tax=Cladophialophora immunda TaxID=569365 RepID=A0A0D1Z543_9EURO|nr:uncharacterized protein PV07_11017 [Cladophialophora immunda]KIW22751.1 hypothetical protein PV07_11017 [Cladophialophora immunda]
MFRHGQMLHKRESQNSAFTSSLPSIIPNPTSGLPPSIAPSSVNTDPSVTASIVTAQAVSGFTTVTETQTLEQSLTGQGIETTFTTERTRTITDPAEYASLTSAAAAASSTSTTLRSSTTSAAATSSAAAQQSSSNLGTLIPAIVVPIAVVLLASLGLFWFFMRRRHRRDLQVEPEFVMTGKGEKLSSRSSSSRSTTSSPRGLEKKSPAVTQTELPSSTSPPTPMSEWPSVQIGAARPLTPQESKSSGQDRSFDQPRSLTANSPYRNMRGPGASARPSTSGRGAQPPSTWEQGSNRNRSNSTPGQRGQPPTSRSGPSPIPRTAPSPVLRSGPSPVPQRLNPNASPRPGASSAFRLRDPSPTMNLSNRAQAPSRLEALSPGAYNGASSISQYSPIVKDTPVIAKPPSSKRPPPPIKTANLGAKGVKSPTSGSPPGHGLTEENLRIARLANSSRLGYTPGEPTPSPKLPPPATRSQLIPRESPKENQDRFFGGSANHQAIHLPQRASIHYNPARASIVSDADDYEDIEAKSDVSSLNEFERFDFGTDVNGDRGSAGGGSLTFFAAQNSPASDRGSAFGTAGTHERW